MPLFTIASAISRTILSLTWLRNLFQLFQPIGGVRASPLARTGSGIASETGAGRAGKGAGASFETRDSSTTWGAGGALGGAFCFAAPRPPPGAGSLHFDLFA